MTDFLTKLQQYRQQTRGKNQALLRLQVDQLSQHRLAVNNHFAIVMPIWERYGYGVGHVPDRRSSDGKTCDAECHAEDVRYYAEMDEFRHSYTADRKRVIDEYNKAVIGL